MIMMGDKKKMVAGIMSKLNDPQPSEQSVPTQDGVEQDDSIGLESAAEELVSAIDSKSPKAIAAAFKSMLEMCSYEKDEPSED